jgi:thiosulfate dehydrogenase [quinone] large subunit
MENARSRAAALLVLRTLVGWHFLYEGYFKMMLPGWSPGGQPLPAWHAAAYLQSAGGPFQPVFRQLATPAVSGWIDLLMIVALIAVGLSLTLGLLTDAACVVGLTLLTLFYLARLPLSGLPQAAAEGTYLIVDKTLVEWGAVLVLLVFRTGRLAGLDRLWASRRARRRFATVTEGA